MSVSLPADVVRYIVDEFRKDRPMLITIASLSRTWYTPARVHHFNCATIRSPKKYDLFQSILKKSPHLGPLVRVLRLYRVAKPNNPAYTSAYENFAQIVPLLTRVRELGLQGPEHVDWESLPESFTQSILTLLQLDSLLSLSLNSISFASASSLQEFFRLPQHIRSLRMDGIRNSESEDEMDSPQPVEPAYISRPRTGNLEKLCIASCETTGIQNWMLREDCALDLRGVREVDFRLADQYSNHRMVSQILNLIGASLEKCTNVLFDIDEDFFDFTDNPNLKSIDLDIFLDTGNDANLDLSNAFPCLESSIATLPPINRLQNLKFNFYLWCTYSGSRQKYFTCDSAWTELASSLSSSNFPCLEKVDVVWYSALPEHPMQEESVRTAMQSLGSRLTFTLAPLPYNQNH